LHQSFLVYSSFSINYTPYHIIHIPFLLTPLHRVPRILDHRILKRRLPSHQQALHTIQTLTQHLLGMLFHLLRHLRAGHISTQNLPARLERIPHNDEWEDVVYVVHDVLALGGEDSEVGGCEGVLLREVVEGGLLDVISNETW
jgi:hypothetical protein